MKRKCCGIFCMVLAVCCLSACEEKQGSMDGSVSAIQTEQGQVTESSGDSAPDREEYDLKITVGTSELYASLEDNPSAEEFRELLEEGPLTVEMRDYGGFEKVGALGKTLTRSDTQITTEPGDVILYQGNQITIYYGVNQWNFTRLAKIHDVSDLKEKLGEGTVEVTFSLE